MSRPQPRQPQRELLLPAHLPAVSFIPAAFFPPLLSPFLNQQEDVLCVWGQETQGTRWQGQQAAEAAGGAGGKPLLHRHRRSTSARDQEGQAQLREGNGRRHVQLTGGSGRQGRASCTSQLLVPGPPKAVHQFQRLDLLATLATRQECSRAPLRCLVHCRCAIWCRTCGVVCCWC